MRIPGSMLHAWTTDQSSQISNFTVYEDTSFNGIMKMGAVPDKDLHELHRRDVPGMPVSLF